MAEQTIIWTVSAYKDIQNIVEYISQDSMYYAMAFYDDVMDTAQTLNEFPQRGRVVPEMDDPEMREIFIHRYRLIYRIQKDRIIIQTIIHGARNFMKE
ncbi:Plasmid stabilization system protein ParE [Fontibacillus panacisegetis]|uniref:Plasmid stabilization system protein ParE n=1 Tax=Fontibacillus panacisegetis TaxID=670482 RepID=A0A1G7ERJ8_9BACL|nr:type II toxin-antitoxin system RelE/ParE family toxin [Fontibacillus panacisegetis]SDE66207.1 Plasmid stabilization system protein ParE [Fontibacillus panacisegetis]